MSLAAFWNVLALCTNPGSLNSPKPSTESISWPYVDRCSTTATGLPPTVVRSWTMPCRVRSTWKWYVVAGAGAVKFGVVVSECTSDCIGTHFLPTRYAFDLNVGLEPSVLHSFSTTVSMLSLPDDVADQA